MSGRGKAEVVVKGLEVVLRVGLVRFSDQIPALESEDVAERDEAVVLKFAPDPAIALLLSKDDAEGPLSGEADI